MANIVAYIVALLVFLGADFVWLGTMARRLYKPTLGDILLAKASLPPTIVFYLAYPLGLVLFAINPALKAGSMSTAAMLGGLFGLFTYGTYDLTNQATVRNWTTTLSMIDMAWGTVLGALTAAIAYAVTRRFIV